MKKILYSFTLIVIIFIITYLVFNNSIIIKGTVITSSKLFINNIFPSLFPMLIISSMLIDIKLPQFLSTIFSKTFNKLFSSPGEASFIFIMSLLSGSFSNAKYINDLIENKTLSINDGKKILLYTYFSNPLFIINTVGILFLNNKKIGIYILLSHILGNIFIGILLKRFNKKPIIKNNNLITNLKDLNNNINNINIFNSLFDSIKSAINSLLSVYGIITFFLIIINILKINNNNFFTILISGIIEMTIGLKYTSTSTLPYINKVYLSMFFISFGGLSIHAQIFNILNKKRIKYLPFLLSRIIHGIISIIILFIIIQLDVLF